MVALLIESGANVNAPCMYGREHPRFTPRQLVVERRKDQKLQKKWANFDKVIELLDNAGATK